MRDYIGIYRDKDLTDLIEGDIRASDVDLNGYVNLYMGLKDPKVKLIPPYNPCKWGEIILYCEPNWVAVRKSIEYGVEHAIPIHIKSSTTAPLEICISSYVVVDAQ